MSLLKNGKYYMYFPLKDRNDIFRIGVAVSDNPYGPFVPEANPMKGSYSIDPAVLDDGDGNYYMYFGGLWGGQLQRYRDNKALESAVLPEGEEEALPARIARLSGDMMEFAEEPRPVIILDENGKPLTAGDTDRRFLKLPGYINIMVNTISLILRETLICFVMRLATILTGRLSIRALSLLQ